jgi:Flp pilus assembly protein TadB
MLDVAALSVMLIAVLFFGTLLVAAWRYPADQSRQARDVSAAARQPATPAATAPAVERPQPARPAASRQQRRREESARRRVGAAAVVLAGAGLALPTAAA